MGNRVNADRWNIESCPSRPALGWARLDSCRTVPYRTVTDPWTTVADRGVRTKVDGHKCVARVLCARNCSREQVADLYLELRSRCCVAQNGMMDDAGLELEVEKRAGPGLSFACCVCSRARAGVDWLPVCCFLLHQPHLCCGSPEVGMSEG